MADALICMFLLVFILVYLISGRSEHIDIQSGLIWKDDDE